MNISFVKDGAGSTDITDVVTPDVEVATDSPTAMVVTEPLRVATNSPVGFNDQDIGFEDILLPRINIVQKVGDLSEVFAPGEIVLKQALVIYSPPKGVTPGTAPLKLTVLGFKRTQFAEKVAGGAKGILANTEAEVLKHGGTLDYNEQKASETAEALANGIKPLKLFQRLATALCLVEKPEFIADDGHVEFPYECQGNYFALVLWAMKGTGYTKGAKVMFTARKIGHLRDGYSKRSWQVGTMMEKFGENYAAIPIVKPGAETSEAFQKFVLEVLDCA